jgi:alkaline phosphatase
VLEAAEARGLATGLVTTSHVTDATPAAFGADLATRYDREGIAAQMRWATSRRCWAAAGSSSTARRA